MQFAHSIHWMLKRRKRNGITDDLLEYAIMHSSQMRDRQRENVLNAIARVQPSGRLLKVVYRREKGKIKIITAYWME